MQASPLELLQVARSQHSRLHLDPYPDIRLEKTRCGIRGVSGCGGGVDRIGKQFFEGNLLIFAIPILLTSGLFLADWRSSTSSHTGR